MWIIIVLLFVLFVITKKVKSNPVQAHVPQTKYETTHFNQTGGRSLEIFEHLKKSGASHDTLLKFATMEDQFLAYEKEVVFNGRRDRKLLALSLDKEIKESFPNYDFSYHITNIKQIHEPEKMINKHLNFFGLDLNTSPS